jgi:tetratricopeptide (TPR) repeat protein
MIMRTNPALAAGILTLALCGAAFAEIFHTNIVTEDGTPLPTSPQIIPAVTGYLVQNCVILNIFGNGSVLYQVNWASRPYDRATEDVCEVTIRMKGYRAMQATFRNNATVVLKRASGVHEGSTVSATALRAPEDARKLFGKGVAAMTDEKWAAAERNFQKAVEIYPEYAAAWSDLGQVFMEQQKPMDARAAWEKAVAADPKYIKPYVQLTKLDLDEKKPEDAISIAGKAVAMNPLEFPDLYFYFAVANFNLKHFDIAEANAQRAIDVDTAKELPQAHVLLATLQAARGDRADALMHFKKYLEMFPKAPDAAQIERVIAQLETK